MEGGEMERSVVRETRIASRAAGMAARSATHCNAVVVLANAHGR
jgi:hypothetical protein